MCRAGGAGSQNLFLEHSYVFYHQGTTGRRLKIVHGALPSTRRIVYLPEERKQKLMLVFQPVSQAQGRRLLL